LVGLEVGAGVGALVGLEVGVALGLAVGDEVGLALGDADGDEVGLTLGDAVGLALGDAVGEEVGVTDGAKDGLSVHNPQLRRQFAAASGYASHLHGHLVEPGLRFTQSQRRISLPPVPGTRNLPGLSWHEDGAAEIVGDADGDAVGDLVGEGDGGAVYPLPLPPLLKTWAVEGCNNTARLNASAMNFMIECRSDRKCL
jgi:hypothetical protein